MGGIVGVYGYYNQQPAQEMLIRKMIQAIKHRGPAEAGEYYDQELALGYRRLGIPAKEEEQQPQFNEDHSKVLVLDGEIYNYRQLYQYLRGKGHYFQTDSDAEVVLHLYEEKGVDFLGDLEGMFSLALWDKRARRLILARDQFGIKPLYYWADGYRLLFASEIKALFQDQSVARELNPRSVADYLAYLYVPAPRSIFLGIYKLPPGYYLLCSPEGYVVRRYWDIEPSPQAEEEAEKKYQQTLLNLLLESVRLSLSNDNGMPIDLLLSGGLDSAILLALGQRLGAALRGYTLGFKEAELDERSPARLLAYYFNIPYQEGIGDLKLMMRRLDQMIQFYDEPLGEAAAILTYEIASQAAAQRQIQTAISGDGGREIFTPCYRYGLPLEGSCLKQHGSAAMVDFCPQAGGGRRGRAAGWFSRLFQSRPDLAEDSLARICFNSMVCFPIEEIERILTEDFFHELGGYDPFILFHDLYRKPNSTEPCSRLQYVEMKTYLPDNVLARVDRAAMANSLRVRLPLLNSKLVEFWAQVPIRVRLKGTEERYLLRKTMEGILPSAIVWRKEEKIESPLRNLLLAESSLMEEEWFQDVWRSPLSEILNFDELNSLWQRQQRGKYDQSRQIWAVLFLCRWYHQHMSRTSGCAKEDAEPALVAC